MTSSVYTKWRNIKKGDMFADRQNNKIYVVAESFASQPPRNILCADTKTGKQGRIPWRTLCCDYISLGHSDPEMADTLYA